MASFLIASILRFFKAFGQMKQDELENQEYGAEAPDLNFRETMA